jgi:hypothetical protein
MWLKLIPAQPEWHKAHSSFPLDFSLRAARTPNPPTLLSGGEEHEETWSFSCVGYYLRGYLFFWTGAKPGPKEQAAEITKQDSKQLHRGI